MEKVLLKKTFEINHFNSQSSEMMEFSKNFDTGLEVAPQGENGERNNELI